MTEIGYTLSSEEFGPLELIEPRGCAKTAVLLDPSQLRGKVAWPRPAG